MDTEQSMQAFLDSLSQLPGSLLFRNDNEWEALAPGDEGEILTLDSSLLPTWQWKQSYYPAMMQYDGATAYYQKTNFSVANAAFSLIARFRKSYTVTDHDLFFISVGGAFYLRVITNKDDRFRIVAYDNTNTLCLRIRSKVEVSDDLPHTFFMDYNPATPSASLSIDGQDVLDTAWAFHLVSAATLRTSATAVVNVGRHVSGLTYWPGTIGFIGWKQADGLDQKDFMEANGAPKPIDTTTWWQWNGQPPIWHESGKLDENKGSAGNFTKNGTLLLADPLLWS